MPKPTQPLPTIFQKYAGMQIPNQNSRPTADGEKLLKEIYDVAADNNVTLRLWTPGMMGTMDWNPSRVNIHTDPNWVISNQCDYG